MKKILLTILTIATIMVVGTFLFFELAFSGLDQLEFDHSTTSKNFVLLEDSVSPDKSKIYYHYTFDQGGSGYSRSFWAVTDTESEIKNLEEYIIPDGYKAVGWTQENELILEEFDPTYYKDKDVELMTGTDFQGVRLRIKK